MKIPEKCRCGFNQSHPIPHEHDRTERENTIIQYYQSDTYKRQCAQELIDRGVVQVISGEVFKIMWYEFNATSGRLTVDKVDEMLAYISQDIAESKQVVKVVDDE